MKAYKETAGVRGGQEILYFRYQRMMRYGGEWHLESRAVLPGCIFLAGDSRISLEQQAAIADSICQKGTGDRGKERFLELCEMPYLKTLCLKSGLVEMSKGIIKNGVPVVVHGPLRGKEELIRKIDRHRRTAEIGIPFEGREQQVTVGLEIYEKRI